MAQVPVNELLAEVMQICRECPTSTLVKAYVRAARMLCNKARWLTQNLEAVCEDGVHVYTLTPDPFHEVIGIQAMAIANAVGGTDYEPLTEGFTGSWSPNDATELPTEYQYLPEGRFALHKTPGLAYPLIVTAIVQPLASAVSLDAKLVVNWDYALQEGALAYLLNLPRTPWTERAEAQNQEAKFRAHMNQALSSALRGYNAGAETTDRNGSTSGGLRTRMLPI